MAKKKIAATTEEFAADTLVHRLVVVWDDEVQGCRAEIELVAA